MKKHRYYIITISVILVLAIAAGAYLYYKDRQKEKTAETQTATETAQQIQTLGKGDPKEDTTNQNPAPVQTKPSTTTTQVAQSLGTLSDVSLTAYLYAQTSVAADGTTTMPAGSIAPFFYMPSGTYTIQKMEAGAWKDIITNQSYPGHGGIAAWFAGPTEDNVTYRVLKIENSKPVSASKTFVIKRSDLTGGVKSYN